jgi:sporulation protein YlmC with PRC-barrel domain
MLRSARDLIEYSVMAPDGYVGRTEDVYFDESEWTVRYIVVDISDIVLDRRVLISLQAVRTPRWAERAFPLSEGSRRIIDSPEYEHDQPVSRQYEIALHRYYEWPIYWGQTSLFDTPQVKDEGPPELPSETALEPDIQGDQEDVYADDDDVAPGTTRSFSASEPVDEESDELEFADADYEGTYSSNLRSVVELTEYSIQAIESNEIGMIRDLFFDDTTWSMAYLAIETGATREERMTLVPITWIDEIEWSSATVRLSMTSETLLRAPVYDGKKGFPEDYVREIYHYYDRLENP